MRGTAAHSGTGVLGEAYGSPTDRGPYGVSGFSDGGTGVRGESEAGNGIEGMTVGNGYGVYGLHFSPDAGSGVYGLNVLGNGVEGFTFSEDPDTAAVRGQSARGNAGLFIGNVKVTGSITKAGSGFRIDHPNDPQNKSLTHSFVESPEMLNVYSGTVTTDEHGNASVALPDYFEALNREFRYQLTTIGRFAQVMVSEEIRDNVFAVQSDSPHVKVCWQVTGVRRDPWAEANRIEVERDKPAAERGGYIHPELFPEGRQPTLESPRGRYGYGGASRPTSPWGRRGAVGFSRANRRAQVDNRGPILARAARRRQSFPRGDGGPHGDGGHAPLAAGQAVKPTTRSGVIPHFGR